MLLTDEEQTKLLEDFYTSTKIKIKALLAKIDRRVDEIPERVAAMRKENEQLHKQTCNKVRSFRKSLANIFAYAAKEVLNEGPEN